MQRWERKVTAIAMTILAADNLKENYNCANRFETDELLKEMVFDLEDDLKVMHAVSCCCDSTILVNQDGGEVTVHSEAQKSAAA